MERLQSHIWLTASSYMVKYLRLSSYIRKPFLIYDFATAPFCISLYMRKFFFYLCTLSNNSPSYFLFKYFLTTFAAGLLLLNFSLGAPGKEYVYSSGTAASGDLISCEIARPSGNIGHILRLFTRLVPPIFQDSLHRLYTHRYVLSDDSGHPPLIE
jgi:hypothetical protein